MKKSFRRRQGVPSCSSTSRTLLLACCLLLFAGVASLPAAETPTELLQRGLIEEEANRNPAAAIKAYEEVVRLLDTQRQMAATAVFRLGESYRKLSRTNDAVAQYRRIVQQFPEETALATLSRQNLTGLGATWNEPGTNGVPVLKDLPGVGRLFQTANPTAASEAARLEAQLAELKKAQPNDRFALAVAFFEDDLLKGLQSNEEKRLAQLAKLDSEVGRDHPTFIAEAKSIEDSRRSMRERFDLVIRIQESKLRVLKAQAGPSATATPQPVNPETAEIERLTALLKASPDLLNAPGAGGKTFLQNAAEQGQLQVVQFLLDQKARIDGGGGLTALHYAVAAGHKAVVELLLSKGADVNAHDYWGFTPVHLATGLNRTVVLLTLLQKMPDLERTLVVPGNPSGPVPWPFESNAGAPALLGGDTPLLVACRAGNALVADILLKAGAKTSAREASGLRRGPLGYAAFNLPTSDRNREQLLTMLVANGAATDRTELSAALKAAAGAGNTNALRVLLKADPWPALLNEALLWAVSSKRLEAVKLLLANKADPETKDSLRQQPLLFSATENNSPDIVEALLQAGANPNQEAWPRSSANRSPDGSLAPIARSAYRPLHMAVIGEGSSIISLLVRHGAVVDGRITNSASPGGTALHWAAERSGSIDAMRELLAAKADVDAQDRQGNTPLHLAILNSEKVKLLLEAKANPNLSNAEDSYPIDRIPRAQLANGTSAIGQMLLAAGAWMDPPRWKNIRVMGGLDTERYSLRKGSSTNVVAELGLMELLAIACPPFPDWAKVRIIRPNRSGSGREIIPVDASKLLSDPTAPDVVLRWGDVVDVPETDRALGAQWSGFDKATAELLLARVKRQVTVISGGATNAVELGSTLGPDGSLQVSLPAKLSEVISQKTPLRTSSDLSRVRVTRKAASGETTPWMFDARPWKPNRSGGSMIPSFGGSMGTADSSAPTTYPDLWLRDGDVVEVPETDAR